LTFGGLGDFAEDTGALVRRAHSMEGREKRKKRRDSRKRERRVNRKGVFSRVALLARALLSLEQREKKLPASSKERERTNEERARTISLLFPKKERGEKE